jgi:hypothetical protein
MKLKIFIISSLFSLFIFLPNIAKAVNYNSCCVCQSYTQAGLIYILPSGTSVTNPLTDSAVCIAKSSFGNDCAIREHELCGEIKIEMENLDEKETINFGNIILGVRIPDLRFSAPPTEVDENGNIYIPWIGEYIRALYNFSMVAISIIAVVMIIVQGLRISASAGGPSKAEAQKKIMQAIIGLFIAWGSYILLFTINPKLTEFKSLDIKFIEGTPQIDLIDSEPLVSVSTNIVNNVPDFKQFDKRWGGEKYGYLPNICECGTKANPGKDRTQCSNVSNDCCTSIQGGGCGPTSLAMVLASYGVSGITPLDTANFMGQQGNGRVCNKGTNFNATVKSLSNSPWSSFSGKEVSQTQALELLKQKKPIVFLCSRCTGNSKIGLKSYKGHYMVLTGMNPDGTIAVNDPGANKSAIVNMTEAQLLDNGGFWYVYNSQ